MSTEIANPEALADTRDALKAKRQERKEDRLELQGTARDLFVARYEDTFEIEVHGNDVEFYRPMSARDVELTGVDEETRERIERGAVLLDQFEARQHQLIRAAQSDEMSLPDLIDESMGGIELMAEVLAAHAVDEDLQDARVWQSIYRNENKLGDLFEDFTAEGESESQAEKLDALENLTSGSSSTN
ncbi:hypothetical protein ORFS9B [Halorubrum tailed virus]|nr:hypothetical protein ORF19 [Halorubrum tailed virus]WDY79106.1 hypothetical protein ORFS9A [Halorubrum tailed virus]WDY79154.1 hypothetical protein ORFS9B [Halorubrum tailed virus]